MRITEQQKNIIEHDGNSFVMASSGSGKTSTIAEKILWIKKKNPLARILYITFTKKAKRHAIEKIGDVPNVLITNFHGLAYFVVSNNRAALRISDVDIVGDSYCLKILERNRPDEDSKTLRKYLDVFHSLQVNCVDPIDMTPEQKAIYSIIRTGLDSVKKFTFDDLILTTIQLINSRKIEDRFLTSILNFDYILCDEVQDNNRLQFMLLETLISINPNLKLTLIGDILQSIYTWRFAVPELALKCIDKYNMEVFPLTINFRSQSSIIDVGNAALDNIDLFADYKQNMNYYKPRGEKVIYREYGNPQEQYSFVCEEAQRLVNSGYNYSDIAVLFRKNSSGSFFEKLAIRNKIPFKLLKGNLLDRKIVKYTISAIKLAHAIVNNESDQVIDSYLSVFAFELAEDIGKKSYGLIKHFHNDMTIIEKLKHLDMLHIKGIGATKQASFKDFYRIVKEMEKIYKSSKDEPNRIISDMSQIVLNFKYFSSMDQTRYSSTIEDLEEFNCLVEDLDGDIMDIICKILTDLSSDLTSSENNAIIGMTVHQAKGTEYKVVFIIDAGDFPLKYDPSFERQEEEKRILYVAITRAMERLYLTTSTPFEYSSIFKKVENFVDKKLLQEEVMFCR